VLPVASVLLALAATAGVLPGGTSQAAAAERAFPSAAPAAQTDAGGGEAADAADAAPGGPPGLLRLPDAGAWVADVFDRALTGVLRGLSEALRRVVESVLGSSLNFVTQTPPAGSYASPTVRGLWEDVRVVANAALALVALWGGLNLVLREHLGAPYHAAMELVPRLVLGALLVNTSLSWGQLAIDANNALCRVVGQAGLPAWERAGTGAQLFADALAVLVYLVASLLLLLQMLGRLALVDVLLVVSPLALLCWVLPQTQGWARLWSGLFFGAVFTQFVQVVTLKLGGALLTELTPMAPDAAFLALFLGVAVLALTLKVPGLMRHYGGDGLGLARVLVYQRVARALDGVRGGGPSPPAPAARQLRLPGL
jgi:hypothetical protein